MELASIETMKDVETMIRRAGCEPEVLARTVNNLPLYVVRVPGKYKPAILITAGVHAGEPSGPYAALALLQLLKTDHEIVVVPNRDPFAFEGYVRALSFAVGRSLSFSTRAEADKILRSDGKVIYEEDGFGLSQVNALVFASKRPSPETTGPQEIWRRIQVLVREFPDLAQVLAGKRIILPTMLPNVEGCGTFERAYTIYVTPDGRVLSLHDMFAEPTAPVEVQAVKKLIDEIKPGLTLDLHEGQGERFYLFTYSVATDFAQRMARALLAGVTAQGYPIYTFADLKMRVGPDISADYLEGDPGVLIRRDSFKPMGPPITMDGYAWRYGPAFLQETGRWTDGGLARRVSHHLWATQSAAHAFGEEFALHRAFSKT